MATNVFPIDGASDNGTAENFRQLFDALAADVDFVYSGGLVTENSGLGTRWVDVAAFVAVINGRLLVSDAVQSTRLTNNSATNKVYVDADGVVRDTTGAIPSNSILLANASITSNVFDFLTYERQIENNLVVYKRQQSDQTVNNTTTLVAATDLQFAVLANQIWTYTIIINWNSSTAAMKLAVNQTLGSFAYLHTDNNGLGAFIDSEALTGTTSTQSLKQATDARTIIDGSFTAAADGDFELQFAQFSATVSDTTIEADSIIIARRIL